MKPHTVSYEFGANQSVRFQRQSQGWAARVYLGPGRGHVLFSPGGGRRLLPSQGRAADLLRYCIALAAEESKP